MPLLSSCSSVFCFLRQENWSNWELRLSGQNWRACTGSRGDLGKVFIIQDTAQHRPVKKPYFLDRRTGPHKWCSFTHSGHQALVPWTIGCLCLPSLVQSLLNSQCHALVLPQTCLHGLPTCPPYALYHDVSCFGWLLTKRCSSALLGLCFFCLGTLSPAQFSHHCIKTNYLNVNWCINNRKGKATKREWEMSKEGLKNTLNGRNMWSFNTIYSQDYENYRNLAE